MKKWIAIALVCVLPAFSVALGGTVDYPITFTENPTTGYEWTYAISDDTVLAVTDEGYTAPDSEEPMVGAPGTHTWVLNGLKAGDASVTFTYTRSWESAPDDPVVKMTFTVDADMNLTLSSTEGIPEKYMPDKAVVQLIENPTTGYQWAQSADKDGILTLDSDNYAQDETEKDAVGVGGVHTWIFSGAAEGTAVLTFNYARSFEDKDPAATVKFTYGVDAQMNVTLQGIDGDYDKYNPNAQDTQAE